MLSETLTIIKLGLQSPDATSDPLLHLLPGHQYHLLSAKPQSLLAPGILPLKGTWLTQPGHSEPSCKRLPRLPEKKKKKAKQTFPKPRYITAADFKYPYARQKINIHYAKRSDVQELSLKGSGFTTNAS